MNWEKRLQVARDLRLLLIIVGLGGRAFWAAAQPTTEGLQLYWQLDETDGAVAEDASGQGIDGELSGFAAPDAQWVAGRVGGALLFEQEGRVAGSGLPDVESTTWSVWVRLGDNSLWQPTVMTADHQGAVAGHSLSFWGDNNLQPRVVWNHDNAGWTALLSPDEVQLEEWNHLALTYNAETQVLTLYVNGEEMASAEGVTTSAFDSIMLGQREANPRDRTAFDGAIDEVAVYDRALNQTEIQPLAEAEPLEIRDEGPPRITRQPESKVAEGRTEVAFSVGVDGTSPFTYEWFHDGQRLPRESESTLVIRAPEGLFLQPEQAGEYHVVVGNEEGEVTSETVTLEVIPVELEDGRVAYWKFDETSGLVAADASTYNNDAELLGFEGESGQWVEGEEGGALRLDGEETRLVVPHTDSLNLGANGAFSFWINPASYGSLISEDNWQPRNGRILRKGSHFDISVEDDASNLRFTIFADGANPGQNVVTLDEWQHFAIVFEGGQVTFYRNGRQIGSPQSGSLGPPNDESLLIGSFNESLEDLSQFDSRLFDGDVDELSIWNRALNQSEVMELAGFDVDGPPSIIDQPAGQEQFLGRRATFSVRATGRRPVSYQWFHDDEPIEGATEGTLVIPGLTFDDAGLYHVVVSNELGEVTSEAVELEVASPEDVTVGLVGYWNFDEGEGAELLDSSGEENHGELVNFDPDSWTEGIVGGGLDFDRESDFVTIPDSPSLNLTDAATFSFWIFPREDDPPWMRVLRKGSNYDLSVTPAEQTLQYRTAGQNTRTSPDLVEWGVWQHFAVVFTEEGDIRFYKNGELVLEESRRLGDITPEPLTLGNFQSDLEITRLYHGIMDELGIWSRALTDFDIEALYRNGLAGRPLDFVVDPLTIRSAQLSTGTGVELEILSPFMELDTGHEHYVEVKRDLAQPSWERIDTVDWMEIGEGEMRATFEIDPPAEPALFLRVIASPPPPLFFDDFEGDSTDWTHGGSEDNWERGIPQQGPGEAVSGENVFATGLDEDYGPDTDSFLRSPAIDLTDVENARLRFWEFRAVDSDTFFQGTVVNILNAETMEVLEELWREGGATGDWQERTLNLGPESLGNEVIVEFRLYSDEFNLQEGWFLDDVVVEEVR